MQFPIRIEKSWRVTRLGAFAILVTFVASLWLATYFLNELKWILKNDESVATQQAYERGYIRAASGDVYNDSTPESTMQAFLDALQREDTNLASSFVTSSLREKVRKDLESLKDTGKLFNLVNYLHKMNKRDSGTGGIEYYSIAVGDNQEESVIVLRQESDGEWRISIFSIF